MKPGNNKNTEAAARLEMLESIEDYSLMLLETDGTVSSWNKGTQLLTGYEAGEITGKSIALLFTPENREQQLPETLLREAAQNRIAERELSFVKKDGSAFPGSIVISALSSGFSALIRGVKGLDPVENLKTIFENTSEGFVLLDTNCVVKAFNSYARNYSFLNTGEELQLGISVFDHFDPARVNVMKGIMAKALEGETIRYDRSYEKEGKTIWLSFTIAPVQEEGKITGICVTGNDITAKKLAEQEKEFDRNNLESLINNTNDLMWSVDRRFCLITSNMAFDQWVRLSIGYSFRNGDNVLPEEYGESRLGLFKAYYERAFRGESFTELLEMPAEYYSEISFYPIYSAGEVIGTACFSRNITEIKKNEKLLRRSEIFSRGILDSLSSQIAVIAGDGTIIAINKSWERSAETEDSILKGAPKGSNYFEVCGEAARNGLDAAALILEGIRDVMAGKKDVFYLEYPRRFGNKDAWFSGRIAKFESDGPMVTLSFQDITDQKRTEESLRRSEAHLKSANKDLETFIYRASHDLRGPLSSIIGLTNVSKIEITDSKALQYIDMIQLSTKKLDETLIALVQSMSIKDVEKFEDEIDFKGMFDDILDRFQYYEGFSKMQFDIIINVQEPFFSSRQILQPVFQNLVENSIKYRNIKAEQCRCTISVSATKENVIITFEDNGMGMDAKIHEKVFDVYYKGTQKSKGSGLGLYIVKTAIEKLDGHIRLESKPGKGSTFIITLPKKPAPHQ